MPRKTEEDRIIEQNDNKIRELVAVNDALRALRDAKKRFQKPKPLTVAEMRQA